MAEGDGASRAARIRAERVLAATALALAVVALLLSRRTRLPEVFGVDPDRLEPVGHLATGLVLAMVATVLLWGRVRRPALWGFGIAAAVTTVLEAAQFLSATRRAGITDGLTNLVGAAAGALLGVLVWRLLGSRAVPAAAAAAVVALVAGVVLLRVDVPLGRSCDFERLAVPSGVAPPAAGGQDRTWDLTTASSSPVEVAEVEGDAALTQAGDGQVDAVANGVSFAGDDAGLRSDTAGNEIGASVRRLTSFRVDVEAVPASEVDGPAPLVMIGDARSPSDINFLVGQDDDDLAIRVRLGCGQFNEVIVDDVFEVGRSARITLAFSDQVLEVWVDEKLVERRRFLGDMASTINWDPSMPLMLGTDPEGGHQYVGVVRRLTIGPGDHPWTSTR